MTRALAWIARQCLAALIPLDSDRAQELIGWAAGENARLSRSGLDWRWRAEPDESGTSGREVKP